MTKDLALAFRAIRKHRAMSQKAVADSIGVSPNLIGRWERGRQQIPWKRARQLCEVYGVALEVVMFLSVDPSTLTEGERKLELDLNYLALVDWYSKHYDLPKLPPCEAASKP